MVPYLISPMQQSGPPASPTDTLPPATTDPLVYYYQQPAQEPGRDTPFSDHDEHQHASCPPFAMLPRGLGSMSKEGLWDGQPAGSPPTAREGSALVLHRGHQSYDEYQHGGSGRGDGLFGDDEAGAGEEEPKGFVLLGGRQQKQQQQEEVVEAQCSYHPDHYRA